MQVTREQLDRLIKDKDWTAVEQADVSEITDMSGLFRHIDGIENLDLSGWGTNNVTDMSNMFSYSNFNHPLDSFDTSNVTNMSNIFFNSKILHPFPQIKDLDSGIIGYVEILNTHERNQNLQDFLRHGTCESLDDLLESFHVRDDVLSQIKQKTLESSITSELPVAISAMKVRF